MYPELAPCVESFIRQNTAAAYLRRRNDAMYINGVTLRDISKHVERTLNLTVSPDTIHRLMKPRRQGTITSKLFKSVIDARVPAKRNSGEKKIHEDFHYTSAQVGLLNEMATYCSQNTIRLSVDNKNKVEVGTPAVNRRSQIRTFHLIPDAPNYCDHDFPHRNSKLTPAGYQVLKAKQTRSRSLSPPRIRNSNRRRRCLSENDGYTSHATVKNRKCEIIKDKIGREKIKWARSGPLTVRINPSRIIGSTNIMHMNFLGKFLHRQALNVYNVIAIADGGPDWSVKGVLNLLSMGYLWKNLMLDILIIQCYAPGHSRFNAIERLWAILTKWLIGVILPIDILGEVPDENSDEWLKVLDQAASLCAKFWDGKFHDGFKVSAQTFLSTDPLLEDLKKSHSMLNEFVYASAKKIKETPHLLNLQNDYKFFVRHCNRKAYQIEFIRCHEDSCTHCSTLPKRENEFLDLINEFGGSCPEPEKSLLFPGHYATFLDQLRILKTGHGKAKKKTSSECPSAIFGRCKLGCSYIFFSDCDRKRHNRLMGHPTQRKRVIEK